MAERSRSLLQVHGAVLLFGLAGLFGKLLLFAPVVIVFGRVVFAALALLLVAGLWRIPLRLGSRRDLLALAFLGLLLAVHWTTFFQSVQVSSVAVALLTFATFPVFVALLEPPLFRERLRAGDVVQAVLALLGILILVPSFEPNDQTTQGALWGVASGLTFALLSLLDRRYVRQHSSITLALYQDVFATVFLAPFAIVAWTSFALRDIVYLLILGVLCTAVAHALFIAGLRGVTARLAGMIVCLEPVYGAALAALVLGEVPTVRTVCGGLVVLAVALYATMHAGVK